jgi:lipid-A-disaccharide synthase
MNSSDNPHHIFLIAGEASGDLHGAHLVKALKARCDTLVFSGIGGQAMQEAGVDIVVDAATLSVVGITEVLSRLPDILSGMAVAKSFLRTRHPDLLILIDFPDFNLKMAAFAKKLKIPILYYISPQIWAWRSGRVTKIGRLVDHIAVILPFEASFYRKHHIPVTFVGHPLLDDFREPLPALALGNTPPVIGLLPGSRASEISRHLPVMLQAAGILSEQLDIQFVLSVAPGYRRRPIGFLQNPSGCGCLRNCNPGSGDCRNAHCNHL